MIVFAHISDLHLDGTERATSRAARVLAYLDGLPRPVDAILVTGDIADHGEPAEYEEAAKLLAAFSAAARPVFTCPGNHDRREAYRSVLLGDPVGGDAPVNRVHRIPGATFVLCDSSIPGEAAGRLDETTLEWLPATLAGLDDGTPVFVGFHHPPVLLHHPVVDAIRLHDAEPLADLLAGHPQVVAVLVGHAHTAAASTFAGRPLLVAPGVVSTVRLPWEAGDELVDKSLPPAVAFHILDDDHRLTTHYRVVL